MYYRVAMKAMTTEGPRDVVTERVADLGLAQDTMSGMIAGVGEENVLVVTIRRYDGA